MYAADGTASEALLEVARGFSPRVEVMDAREVVIDLAGLTRLFGDMRTIAEELRRDAADRGVFMHVAIAGTRIAARLLVRHRAGLTVIEPGAEAGALAPLPIELLVSLWGSGSAERGSGRGPDDPNDLIRTWRRWGLRTLGDLAALSADDVAARLGQDGVRW